MHRCQAFFLAVLLSSCHGAQVRGQFADRLPLERVPERRFTPAPSETTKNYTRQNVDDAYFKRADQAMALAPHVPAGDVNSLDEIPDSSWFQSRVGHRAVTAEEVGHGSEIGTAIDVDHDLTIVNVKREGAEGGFVVDDANGARFLLKLDPIGHLGLATGADAVGARLIWALGYNVPDDRIVTIDPARLVPKDDKTAKLMVATLAIVARTPDGKLRALASRWIEGEILGPSLWTGTRKGDLNDLIPHEHRRTLRALRVFFAWINNSDAKTGNSIDTFVVEPGALGGLVKHYLIDFGTTLGTGGSDLASGWWVPGTWHVLREVSHGLDDDYSLGQNGVRRIRREREGDYLLAGLGPKVNPWSFNFNLTNQAFRNLDYADAAWAARQLIGFSDDQLAAAAAASGWEASDQARLVRRLHERRDDIVRRIFDRATSLGSPRIAGRCICMEDLAVTHGFATEAGRTYSVTGGGFIGAKGGDVCVEPSDGDGYHVVEIAAHAKHAAKGRLRVHLMRGDAQLRIVGVEHE
jgi:hypothetical protein